MDETKTTEEVNAEVSETSTDTVHASVSAPNEDISVAPAEEVAEDREEK